MAGERRHLGQVATIHLAVLVWANEVSWSIVSLGAYRWALVGVVWVVPSLWLFRQRGAPPPGSGFPFAALLIWSGWMLVAAAWSTAVPVGHLLALGTLGTVLASALYAASDGWERFCRVVAVSLLLFIMVGVLYELAGDGIADRFAGIGRNPTDTGRLGVVMALAGFAGFRHRLPVGAGFLVSGLAVSILSDARTATFGLVLAVLFIASRRSSGGLRIAMTGTVGLVIVLGLSLLSGQTVAAELVSRTESGVDLTTLTGRVSIWEFTIEEAGSALLIGHGTASSSDLFQRALFDGALEWDAGTAHSLWLHTQLELGVVGCILLFLVVAGVFIARRTSPHPERDGLLLALLVNSFTESLLHEPSISLMMLAGAVGTFLSPVTDPSTADRTPPSSPSPVHVSDRQRWFRDRTPDGSVASHTRWST